MASTPDPDQLAALRREYGDSGLDHPDLTHDPIAMFRRWMHDAVVAGLHEPNAMVVSTVSAQGWPSSRMVLLKAVDQRGFVFYTNYDSRKGAELSDNPHAALLFPWHDLQRQVRIEGRVEQVSREESVAYFATRPRDSQGPGRHRSRAWSARGRTWSGATPRWWTGSTTWTCPCPRTGVGTSSYPRWSSSGRAGGGGMHDRLVYHREGEGWETVRLAP